MKAYLLHELPYTAHIDGIKEPMQLFIDTWIEADIDNDGVVVIKHSTVPNENDQQIVDAWCGLIQNVNKISDLFQAMDYDECCKSQVKYFAYLQTINI